MSGGDSDSNGPAPEQLAARVTELEGLFTHQQRMVHELHDVVLSQDRRLSAAEATLSRLTGELSTLVDSITPRQSPEDERPPHY